MTTEEKELLLKDLSARLPYGVKCCYDGDQIGVIYQMSHRTVTLYGDVNKSSVGKGCFRDRKIEEIKPYLFPLSSMTEEQRKEFNSLGDLIADIFENNRNRKTCIICSKPTTGSEGEMEFVEVTQDDIIPAIDWLNKNHFDYRGLISRGLALDATDLNIYS